jgi:hypothetical protein
LVLLLLLLSVLLLVLVPVEPSSLWLGIEVKICFERMVMLILVMLILVMLILMLIDPADGKIRVSNYSQQEHPVDGKTRVSNYSEETLVSLFSSSSWSVLSSSSLSVENEDRLKIAFSFPPGCSRCCGLARYGYHTYQIPKTFTFVYL